MKQRLMNSNTSRVNQMTIYSKILKCFDTYENQFYFKAENCFKVSDLPEFGFFKTIVERAIPSRDAVSITLTNDSDEQFSIADKTVYEYEQFLSDTDEVDVLIKIDKKVNENCFSVYDYSAFVNNLLNLSILKQLEFFSNVLSSVEERLLFQIYDDDFEGKEFSTSSITFVYCKSEPQYVNFRRINRLQQLEFVNSFYDFNKFKLIPDDFHILSSNFKDLKNLFKKFETLFSIIYLSSFSSIRDEKLELSVLPTKIITEVYELSNLGYQANLFELYNWIFIENNYLDKLSIAKHELENNQFIFQKNVLNISNILRLYNLYISKKSSEFLKAKVEVGDFILDKIFEMYQYKNVISGCLGNNFFALIGFLFTTIIANIVSDSPLNNIFTEDILWLLLFLLLGSYVYWYLSDRRFRNDIRDFETLFNRLKSNYTGIFSEEELAEMFQAEEFKSLKGELSEYRLKIKWIWLAGITLLLIWVGSRIRNSGQLF